MTSQRHRQSGPVCKTSTLDLNVRMKLAEGGEDFHTLSWLEYANLMMGKFDEAKKNVQTAKETADRNPSNAAIREKEVAAASRWAKGQKDEALKLAKEAADIELTLNAPSGPPDPIKPALEFYGDMLLDAGRPKEAASAYEQWLLRTPNRTPSVKALAKAKGGAATSTTVSR